MKVGIDGSWEGGGLVRMTSVLVGLGCFLSFSADPAGAFISLSESIVHLPRTSHGKTITDGGRGCRLVE